MRSTKTLIALTLCAWVLPSVARASAPKAVDGWRIQQRCILQGDEQIVACSQGVKVYNPKNDLTIVYAAPFKEVVYFDKRTGLVCKVPAGKNDNPYQRTIGMFSGLSLADVPLHKVASSKVVDLPTDNFVSGPEYAAEQLKLAKAEGHGNRIKFVAYGVFTSLQLPANEYEFLAKQYGLPHKTVVGVPAHLLYKSISDKSTVFLSTQSCSKAKISESEFAVPPNLKPANSSQAVVAGDNAGMLLLF